MHLMHEGQQFFSETNYVMLNNELLALGLLHGPQAAQEAYRDVWRQRNTWPLAKRESIEDMFSITLARLKLVEGAIVSLRACM